MLIDYFKIKKNKFSQHGFTQHHFFEFLKKGLFNINFLKNRKLGLPSTTFLKFQKSGAGFTLLEITVAMGVFVILFTLTLGIYSSTLKTERRTVQMSKLQKEAQLIMEILAKKIRTNKINYDFYIDQDVDIIAGEDYLALLDNLNNETVFRLSLDKSIEVCSENCGTEAVPNENNFNAIPATDILIDRLTFYITPSDNPFINLTSYPVFPKTTIVIDLRNTTGESTRNLIIQQTIPQRLAGP